jgi:hypothetical protein
VRENRERPTEKLNLEKEQKAQSPKKNRPLFEPIYSGPEDEQVLRYVLLSGINK